MQDYRKKYNSIKIFQLMIVGQIITYQRSWNTTYQKLLRASLPSHDTKITFMNLLFKILQ